MREARGAVMFLVAGSLQSDDCVAVRVGIDAVERTTYKKQTSNSCSMNSLHFLFVREEYERRLRCCSRED